MPTGGLSRGVANVRAYDQLSRTAACMIHGMLEEAVLPRIELAFVTWEEVVEALGDPAGAIRRSWPPISGERACPDWRSRRRCLSSAGAWHTAAICPISAP